MNHNICYKNHDKIVKIHKFLKSKKGKNIFHQKIKLLNHNDSKTVLYQIIKKNWKDYFNIIKQIKKICKNIIKLPNIQAGIKFYAINLHHTLSKINTPKKLHNFIYKLINHKSFYDSIVSLYKILSDKKKCNQILDLKN